MTLEQQEKFQILEENIRSCQKCSLCKTRKNVVVMRGNPEADLLFIGEAPGEREDLEGKPFVGPAGQLLHLYLTCLALDEDDYAVINILKCRPPRNRDPLPEEEEACMEHLIRQVQLISPKIVVCLGRIAAKRIISPDFRITQEHGKWFRQGNKKITATFHPSALIRDPAKKELALDDFKSVLNEWNQKNEKMT